jgi:CubicO group peptidase (beta-lactamase class C family)
MKYETKIAALIFTLLCWQFHTTMIFGQQQLKNKPKHTIATSINKARLIKKLDSLFVSINNYNSPGCAVTVIENGKVIVKRAYGMASIEFRIPFTHHTVVRMPYSEGREFISIAAVLMEQDGILSLNDKVRKYFPKLPDWVEPVVIWDLLNHRSGFIDEWSAMMLTQASMANRFDLSQFLNLLYTQPKPEVEPGKGYMYSNSDFGLLRLILEKASGKDLAEWLKKRVFDPLKMRATHMLDNASDVIPNNAGTYYSSGNKKYSPAGPHKTSPGANYVMLTNAEDLEKWIAVCADSSTDIAKATRQLLAKVRIVPGKENHFVCGYSKHTFNNQQVFYHEGVNGFNYATRIPAKGLAIITFGNMASQEGFGIENKSIVNYLLTAPGPSQQPRLKFLTNPVSITKDELSKYEGKYLWQDQISWDSYVQERKLSEFFVDSGKLKVRWPDKSIIELIPVGKDIFYQVEGGFGAQFIFTQSSLATQMAVEVKWDDGYPGPKMIKDTNATWQPSKETLTRIAGKYYSKHLDFYWTIELNEEGKLIIKRPTVADKFIEPDGLNQFRFTIDKSVRGGFDAWILFHTDEKGNITHFTVWHVRLMHHRFDRL